MLTNKSSLAEKIFIAVDISEAFDTVSNRLLLEMNFRYRLRYNVVRWLVLLSTAPIVVPQANVSQGSFISPTFLCQTQDCHVPDSSVNGP